MPDRSATPPLRPLSIPIFRAVWIASIASNFGGLIQSVGAAWLMISLDASPGTIALVQASTTLPIMLLSLFAGAVADNLDRRRVMLAAQAFMLCVSVALGIAAWTGVLTPWLLLAFTFALGCGTAFNGPAWQASVGDMVPRGALPEAVALNSMGFNIARSVGPAVGGAIVAAAGAAAAFAVNAVSYLGLIAVLWRWRPELPPRLLPRERLGEAMAAGVRYVRMSPAIRLVLLRALLFGFAASAVPALMPLVARDLMTGGALTYGALLGAFGVGAVGGALASRRLRGRHGTERIVRGASAMMGVGAIGAGGFGLLPLVMAALALAGAGWVLALSTFNVTVQLSAPRWVVARALALYQMAAFGGMAAGAWGFGLLAEHRGVTLALAAAAMMQGVVMLVGLARPLPASADADLDPLGRWTEPATQVPVEPRSGPIVVTLEYRIAPGDVVAFLAVMAERRRIRRRDGARHWALLRDLGDPGLWLERYHVATWLGYVRHQQRRTQADAVVSDQLFALNGGLPMVHRLIERQTGSLPPAQGVAVEEFVPPMTDPTQGAV